MERVYFDTSIYNNIIDKKIANGEIDILERAIGKEIEIIFSDSVLSELASTLESTTIKNESERYGRTKNLFRCALGLISKKIVENWNVLIREEIEAFIQKREKPDVFCNEEETKKIVDIMKKIAQGKKNYNKKFLNKIHLQKREDLERQRKVFNSGTLKNTQFSKYSNFEQFYTELFNPSEEEPIKDLLLRNGINNNVAKKVEEIRDKLDSLPHLKASLKIPAALCFSVVKENRKPKWGDKYDLYHFVCTTSLDIFVTNDSEIFSIYRWVYNNKRCMNLCDFIKYLSNRVDVQAVN